MSTTAICTTRTAGGGAGAAVGETAVGAAGVGGTAVDGTTVGTDGGATVGGMAIGAATVAGAVVARVVVGTGEACGSDWPQAANSRRGSAMQQRAIGKVELE